VTAISPAGLLQSVTTSACATGPASHEATTTNNVIQQCFVVFMIISLVLVCEPNAAAQPLPKAAATQERTL
jgi:hypothetical protein